MVLSLHPSVKSAFLIHMHWSSSWQFNADHFPCRRTIQTVTASTHAREPIQLRKQELLCLPRVWHGKKGVAVFSLSLQFTGSHRPSQLIGKAGSREWKVVLKTCREVLGTPEAWNSSICYPSAFCQCKSPFFFKPKLKCERFTSPRPFVLKVIHHEVTNESRLGGHGLLTLMQLEGGGPWTFCFS